jgi:hypothetical protein
VCVNKIAEKNKMCNLKKLKEGKIFCAIFLVADCYLTAQR